jgi:hypothetical protein
MVTWGWRRVHNEDPNALCSSLSMGNQIKDDEMGEHVPRMLGNGWEGERYVQGYGRETWTVHLEDLGVKWVNNGLGIAVPMHVGLWQALCTS